MRNFRWLSELSIFKFAKSLNHFSWSFVYLSKRVKGIFSFEFKKKNSLFTKFQLVERRTTGGLGFEPQTGPTRTQGLKITERICCLCNDICKSSRIGTINRRPRLLHLHCYGQQGTLKKPHSSQRVGQGVPGAVVWSLPIVLLKCSEILAVRWF